MKSGTFDRKTGALKQPLGPTSSPKAAFTLEGTVTKDSARGRAIDSTGEGTFAIVRKN